MRSHQQPWGWRAANGCLTRRPLIIGVWNSHAMMLENIFLFTTDLGLDSRTIYGRFYLTRNFSNTILLNSNKFKMSKFFNNIIQCVSNRARCILTNNFLKLCKICILRVPSKIRSTVIRSRIRPLGAKYFQNA